MDARPHLRQLLAGVAAMGLALAGFGAADRVAAAPQDTTTGTTSITSGTTTDTTSTTGTTAPPTTTTHSTTTKPTTTRPTTTTHTTPSTTTRTTGSTSTGATMPQTTTTPRPRRHRRHVHPLLAAGSSGGGHVPPWLIGGLALSGVLILSGLGGLVFTRTRRAP